MHFAAPERYPFEHQVSDPVMLKIRTCARWPRLAAPREARDVWLGLVSGSGEVEPDVPAEDGEVPWSSLAVRPINVQPFEPPQILSFQQTAQRPQHWLMWCIPFTMLALIMLLPCFRP